MIFTLPLPETTNSAYKSGKGHWYKSAKAQNWEEEAGWIIKRSWHRKPIINLVTLELVFYLKRDRDIDGSIKPVLDLLQRLKVYENDRQVVELHVIKATDKDWPRVEISLTNLKA